MEQYVKDYLTHVGMGLDYRSAYIACEICGDTTYTVIREEIDIGREKFGKYPVVSCNTCGFLYQNPRFERKFYDDYYQKFYRNVIQGKSEPTKEFIDDQIKRGELLYESLKKYFRKPGAMMDVGSSAGGMMIAFKSRGWSVYGNDPDEGFVRFGKEILGLPVEAMSAEDMQLGDKKFDFIMILGSLEHVYDPNAVLAICRKASNPGALLLLEGRGNPRGHTRKFFNHNHHRYFSLTSFGLIMRKHGWEPELSTQEPLSGPTRAGSIFCLGRVTSIPSREDFKKIVASGKKEEPQKVLKYFNEIDAKNP